MKSCVKEVRVSTYIINYTFILVAIRNENGLGVNCMLPSVRGIHEVKQNMQYRGKPILSMYCPLVKTVALMNRSLGEYGYLFILELGIYINHEWQPRIEVTKL